MDLFEGTHEQLNVDVDGGGNGVRKCIQEGTNKEKTREHRAFLVGNKVTRSERPALMCCFCGI